jgi:type IV pilus assembly protein PilC
MLIKYKALDRSGRVREGVLEAESEKAAEELLWASDLIVTRVRRVRRLPPVHKLLPTVFGVREGQLIPFTRQLATLLEAGIPVLKALEVLRNQTVHPALKSALTDMVDFLRAGGLFSEAIRRHPTVFPSIFIRFTRIGEETGDLPAVLRRIADYFQNRVAMRDRLRSSLTYPAIVTVVAVGALYILFTFSIPMLAGLFKEFEAELPLPTRVILSLGTFAKAYGTRLILLLAVLGVGAWFYSRTQRGSLLRDQLALKIPVIGPLLVKSNLARIADALNQLLTAGVGLLEALELTRDSLENRVFSRALDNIRGSILAGRSLSQAMMEQKVFPPLMTESVGVAEETGNLAEQLRTLAIIYQEELNTGINRFIALLEPTLILFVGGVVGLIGFTVINTVYSIIPQIGATR